MENTTLGADTAVGKLSCTMPQTWHRAFRQLRVGEVLMCWAQWGGTWSAGQGKKHKEANVLPVHFQQAWAKHWQTYNRDQSCISRKEEGLPKLHISLSPFLKSIQSSLHISALWTSQLNTRSTKLWSGSLGFFTTKTKCTLALSVMCSQLALH